MKNIKNFSKEIKKNTQNETQKSTETVTVRLTEREKNRLRKLASACKISQTQLIKKLIEGAELRAIPPEEFYKICEYLGSIREEIFTRCAQKPEFKDQIISLNEAVSEFKNACKLFYDEGIFGAAYAKCGEDFLHEMEESEAMFGGIYGEE